MLSLLLSALMATGSFVAPKDDFWSYWGDGKAEISSYKTIVTRYDEPREGDAVLIFVTEDISRRTRIKVETDDVPKKERVPVLKLNHVVKFTTGIYDYSLMTSVFSAVESELGQPPFRPMKISFSAQEWCGHVFMMLIPQRTAIDYTLHSYFQREGDRRLSIGYPQDAMFEDNLLIWIRELKGEVMQAGERREMPIMPSMWYARSRHTRVQFEKGWIQKTDGGSVTVAGQAHPAWKWTWQVAGRTVSYWVEKAYPRRILKWESSNGDRGELMKSVRLPYWKLNENEDVRYREQLNLPH